MILCYSHHNDPHSPSIKNVIYHKQAGRVVKDVPYLGLSGGTLVMVGAALDLVEGLSLSGQITNQSLHQTLLSARLESRAGSHRNTPGKL